MIWSSRNFNTVSKLLFHTVFIKIECPIQFDASTWVFSFFIRWYLPWLKVHESLFLLHLPNIINFNTYQRSPTMTHGLWASYFRVNYWKFSLNVLVIAGKNRRISSESGRVRSIWQITQNEVNNCELILTNSFLINPRSFRIIDLASVTDFLCMAR